MGFEHYKVALWMTKCATEIEDQAAVQDRERESGAQQNRLPALSVKENQN